MKFSTKGRDRLQLRPNRQRLQPARGGEPESWLKGDELGTTLLSWMR